MRKEGIKGGNKRVRNGDWKKGRKTEEERLKDEIKEVKKGTER